MRTATSELAAKRQRADAVAELTARREGGGGERASACMRTCERCSKGKHSERKDKGREAP